MVSVVTSGTDKIFKVRTGVKNSFLKSGMKVSESQS